jgi:hypothetical protein
MDCNQTADAAGILRGCVDGEDNVCAVNCTGNISNVFLDVN